MPDVEEIKVTIAVGIRSALTWQNIGSQLALGAASGLGAFAVKELLTFITNELDSPITIADLIAKFEQDIRQAVQDIEIYVDEGRFADNVVATLASATEKVPTYAPSASSSGDPERLEDLWNQVLDARAAAAVIDVDPDRVHLGAFGIYFTILDLQVAISEMLAGMPSQHPERETDLQWWTRWRNASQLALDHGHAYLRDKARKLRHVNELRVTVDQLGSIPGLPGTDPPTAWWFVFVDGLVALLDPALGREVTNLAVFPTFEEAWSERRRQVDLLQWHYAIEILHPATLILARLDDLKPKIWHDLFLRDTQFIR